MRLLYGFFLFFYRLLLHGAAFFHPKARLWVEGRRDWRKRYSADFQKKSRVLWVHVASLGEFEQGRPLIEAFRQEWPDWQVVLTFFSPSGYEVRKGYPQADFIDYLPIDTRKNARDFLDVIRPDAAIFIKYEFWATYLFELKKRGVPTLLVSALFRENQPFFLWWGGLWRRMLGCFTHFFVQNQHALELLQRVDFQNVTVAGDTRVDRVLALAAGKPENEWVRAFVNNRGLERVGAKPSPVLVAGSSWPADEAVFLPVLQRQSFRHWKIIVAPHEPSDKAVREISERFLAPENGVNGEAGTVVRYSELAANHTLAPTDRLLLIDNVGLLNTLYRYGSVAYIGGGFGKGIHNILEPAAWGLPIIFGPKYEKFEEAQQLVARQGAFVVRTPGELADVLERLSLPDVYEKAVMAVRHYLAESAGATEKVLTLLRDLFPAE